jgi:type I restriction enzyme M protein
MTTFQDNIRFLWDIAELLRGDYRRSDYGKVILPFTVLRRLDCVLEATRPAVLAAVPDAVARGEKIADYLLNRQAGYSFHNRSPYDFPRLLAEPGQIAANLTHALNGFSPNIREVFEYFAFAEQIIKLDKANLLYQIVQRFAAVDLHPDRVRPEVMGTIFEDLIRRFSEQSNETAGEHFTPREVIKLMVNLLLMEDRELLSHDGIVRTLYDPACGTGGMLSVAEEYLHTLNNGARLEVFGQELNPEAYAICKADMIIKGNNAGNIKFGNSFTQDGLPGEQFDYLLSNPPFGVEWKRVESDIRREHETQGHAGRFGAGLPRISDGSLLFLQHMLAKCKTSAEGSRLGIVFNGSPLFSGGAGSGESEIRRWIIENDWLEAIVALPDQLFYNTGISTYIWVLTNRKAPERRGKVQLISGVHAFLKMRKSLGNKRHEIGDGTHGKPDQIADLTHVYGDFTPGPLSKIFDNADFGYRRITVERPLRLRFSLTPDSLPKIQTVTLPEEVKQRALTALTPLLTPPPLSAAEGHPSEILTLTGGGGAACRDGGGLTPPPALRGRPGGGSPPAPPLSGAGGAWADALAALHAAYRAQSLKAPSPKHLRTILFALGERDETADICTNDDGSPIPDPELRDFENVPLTEDVTEYFAREVLPHVPDAWINTDKCDETDGGVGIVGYEIPFTRHFYEYTPLRALDEIEAEIAALEAQIQGMLHEAMK